MDQDSKLIAEAYLNLNLNTDSVESDVEKLQAAGFTHTGMNSGTSAHMGSWKNKNSQFVFKSPISPRWVLQYKPGFGAPFKEFNTLDELLASLEEPDVSTLHRIGAMRQ
jgi:hypothetical protein